MIGLSGLAAIIEMVYHLQLNAAMGPEVRFAGFTLNTEASHSWFGCVLLVATGFGLFELARRQYLHDWGESQEFIEKEVKRREEAL